MLTVRELIASLKNVDKDAYVTIIVPYTIAPIYLEEVIATKTAVTLTGRTRFENTTEEMIHRFGEENRTLITSAVEFMENMVKEHDLKNFNYINYIGNLLDHKFRPEVHAPDIGDCDNVFDDVFEDREWESGKRR